MRRPAIVLLHENALPVAEKIKQTVEGDIYAPAGLIKNDYQFDKVRSLLAELYDEGRPIIGILATGILIRCLASKIQDKWQDPPVVAVAHDGSAVVPLLGGHHGANDLANILADNLETSAAITTSGDLAFNIALDNPPQGYVLQNPDDAKVFMAQLLQGNAVQLEGTAPFLEESTLRFSPEGALKISVTTKAIIGNQNHLVYHPKSIILGMGSERGVATEEAITLAEDALIKSGVSKMAIAAITSIDLKADESALHDVARHFDVPIWFFSADELEEMEGKLKTPSKQVKAEVGVLGVAEAAALKASQGTLILPKIKSKRTTAALAEAPALNAIQKGRERGCVFLIGVGPGDRKWRSKEAIDFLSQSTDWVGYDLYLDLVQDLKHTQKEHRFPLGEEEKRVRHALELAASGKRVAVVCSGDPGIFAMATLAYELIDTGAAGGPLSDGAKQVEVITSPGISAFQAAAARAGAPIGHDFCCISLSDLLTPRADILKRIKAAAEGDFVTAFYNPRSKRRITLLDEAFEMLRTHRPPETPVILATDLGRLAENVRVETLASVQSNQVDMLTLVMVGSSNSKAMTTGDGKTWVYTPRGYDKQGHV